jgi:hypothetical protein
MITLAGMVLFLFGLHLALHTVAACYRIIDLWYTIRTTWPRVLGGILAWVTATAGIAVVLPERLRAAFLWGVGSFVPFYLGLYVIRHPLLWRRQAPPGP